MNPEPLFTPGEIEALQPPPKLLPAEWAELYRILGEGQSDIPGPWRNSNAPYLVGIMNLAAAVGVEQINIMKAGQIGVSEALRNIIGWWAHTQIDPMGIALPDKPKGRKIVENRIIPMFENTEPLKQLHTDSSHDIQKEQIKLTNGFIMHLMWSGSPSSTSADPMRLTICDEVDKFRNWGREPDPVGRIFTRGKFFGDRKIQINASTPTTRFGEIYRLWDESIIKLWWMVRCPLCGHQHRLIFPNLKYQHYKGRQYKAKKALAARIVEKDAAWFLCPTCDKKITNKRKVKMLREGVWRTLDNRIENLEEVEEFPRGTRIGMQIGAQNCTWEPWSNIAAQHIRAGKWHSRLFSFYTETLGVPFEDLIEKPKPSIFSDKSRRATLPEGTIPKWAYALIAAVDTQHDHFWIVVRAWGPDMISQRVFHDKINTWGELDQICFKHPWPIDGGGIGRVTLTLIDSGGTKTEGDMESRTMEVYKWILSRQRYPVWGIKGVDRSKQGVFIRDGAGWMRSGMSYGGKKRRPDLRLKLLDVQHFQDELAHLIAARKPELWLLNQADDAVYNDHMSGLHKTALQKGNQLVETWVPVEAGIRHDLRDCEGYSVAGAYLAGVHRLPPLAEYEKLKAEASVPVPKLEDVWTPKPEQESSRDNVERRDRGGESPGLESLEGYL